VRRKLFDGLSRFGQFAFNRILSFPQPHCIRVWLLRGLGAQIGSGVAVHGHVRVLRPRSLSLGRDTTVNRGALLDARGGLVVGDAVMIGAETRIYSAGHDVHSDDFATIFRTVTLSEGVVLFPNCIVLPGVTIGRAAVGLTGSVISRDVPPGKIVGGNPAAPISDRRTSAAPAHRYRVWFAEI
jgi:acetyltransferase-like isoleucine patch superfamily enzyme